MPQRKRIEKMPYVLLLSFDIYVVTRTAIDMYDI